MFCSFLIMLCSFLISFGCQHIFMHFFALVFITFAIDTDLSFKFLVFVFALCERLFLLVIMINCSHSQRQIRVRVDMPMGELVTRYLVWQQGSCASCLTWCQSSWWPLSHMTVGPHKQLLTPDGRVFSQMIIPWSVCSPFFRSQPCLTAGDSTGTNHSKRVVAINQCHLAQPDAPVFFFWNSPHITPVQLDPSGGVVGINGLFICCQVPIRSVDYV